MNPSTATRMIDRLVRKQLVRRSRSASDRRIVRLRLTGTGRHVVEQVLARRRSDLEALVAETAQLWQPAVITALTAFAAAAGEAGEQDWWLGWTPGDGDAA
ncbi:MarR family transcriptional regulator [Dactylosporangium sp. NPDC000521]|uniref:MarR family transcriptional regulator n=1 Tax=Dactylosporangium sp. NPDC000521 TaxID=3363975 RepID=UPI0036ABDD0A